MKTKHIVDYLNTNFPTNGSIWLPEDVISKFLTEFGVDVKTEPHTDGKFLFGFKYSMLGAKWQFPITHECRGIIIRNSVDGWEVMAYPFNKFFNQHEGNCPIFKEEEFNAHTYELSFIEKIDGSCLEIYFDKYKNEWRASTLGSITTGIIHDSGVKFDDLFWKVINKDLLVPLLVPGKTYIFELCTKLNRVVTRYPTDRAYILGIRNEKGQLMSRGEIFDIFNPLTSLENKPELYFPAHFPLEVLDIFTLQQAQEWVELQAGNKEFGEYAEGFVVADRFGPICKMKNSAYLALHHSLSDPACTRKAVIAAFFNGHMDDLYPALPEMFQKLADRLKDWLNDFKNYLNTQVAPSFHFAEFKTRKDYALYVLALPERERMFQAFFFAHQAEICDPKQDMAELFTKWIVKNHEKYESYWKTLVE